MMDDMVVRYRGPGYLVGVPARDMTMDEWECLPLQMQTAGLRLGLYELPQPAHESKSVRKPGPARESATEEVINE